MGFVPDWYELIRAARYLNVPPWELAERSVWWQNRALEAEYAEISARNSHNG